MARKGENIYKRKDGRWEGRYIKGRKPDGLPIFGSVYGRKYNEVKKKLLVQKLKYQNNQQNDSDRYCGLFGDYITVWLSYAEERVKPSTLAGYCYIVHKHILPALGGLPVLKLKKEHVDSLSDELCAKGFSSGTRHNILRLLLAILRQAEKDCGLDGTVFNEINLPAVKRKKTEVLSRTEQGALEQAALRSSCGTPVLLALYTGMRIGEICALCWKNVDLREGIIHVTQTVQRSASLYGGTSKTTVQIGSPKSHTSERIVPLPGVMLEYLKALKKSSITEYVVSCKRSIAEPRIVQYRFYKLLKQAGIRHINFHMLRHTYAVRCMELHMDVTTLSQILGHASPKMTLDVYTDSLLEHKKAEVQALERICAWNNQI